MNRKTNIPYLMIVFVLGIAAATSLSLIGFQTEVDIAQAPSAPLVGSAVAGKVAGVAVEQADVLIDRGTGTSVRTYTDVSDNSTVLDALEGASQAFGMTIETKWYGDAGTLVTSVGGLTNGQDNKYWTFYINGKLGTVAMDKQIVQSGDKIEFRFEPSPF